MEFVVAKIKRGVDGFEGLEVNVDLAFLSLRRNDFSAIDNESIWWYLIVQLQTLLRRSNGGQDRQTIDSRFNVRGGTLQRLAIASNHPSRTRLRILLPTSSLLGRPGLLGLRGSYVSKTTSIVSPRPTATYE